MQIATAALSTLGLPIASSRSDVDLIAPRTIEEDEDVSVRLQSGRWIMTRGDFRAEFDRRTGHGWVRQSPNPYSIDGVLRILHSLFLAREGGFLVHAASAVRNGRAFLFAGVSRAGKDHPLAAGPPRCRGAYRRNLLRAPRPGRL